MFTLDGILDGCMPEKRKRMDGDKLVIENYINGEFTSTETEIDSYNPATGCVWAKLPDSGEVEVATAVASAKAAYPMWSSLPTKVRSEYLMKIAEVLEKHLDVLALCESLDQGKPVSLARAVDIPRVVHNFRYFATYILHRLDDSSELDDDVATNYTTHHPIGVAGLISPWNLPLYLLTFKLAPALAAGNTVVCKPSEMTSVTTWIMCSLIHDHVGLPPGVLNVVFGYGGTVGNAITSHPSVPIISFTGSTLTGEKISLAAAPHFKKLSLELGGKNAGIIFDDMELERCIPTILRSCFTNQGEVCTATSRLFVQRKIYEAFLEELVSAVRGLQVGDPRESSTKIGPVISQDHADKIRRSINQAKESGAQILCGEGVNTLELPKHIQEGYYVLPTVITNVADTYECMQEEIFGPVVCVVPFDTEEEVIFRANSVRYGLGASVWTNRLGRAHRVAQKLQVGTVWVNCWMVRDLNMPFGGCKASGLGRESGKASMEFYTEAKTICIKTTH